MQDNEMVSAPLNFILFLLQYNTVNLREHSVNDTVPDIDALTNTLT